MRRVRHAGETPLGHRITTANEEKAGHQHCREKVFHGNLKPGSRVNQTRRGSSSEPSNPHLELATRSPRSFAFIAKLKDRFSIVQATEHRPLEIHIDPVRLPSPNKNQCIQAREVRARASGSGKIANARSFPDTHASAFRSA